MANVGKESANWRLFGGGGLLVGGIIWLVGTMLSAAALGGVIGSWLGVIGLVVVGIAALFVAFGQTGSNGAVRNSVVGKVALVAFGLGWIVFAIVTALAIVGIDPVPGIAIVAAVLLVLGGVVSVVSIFQENVARGLARWILAVPVILVIVWVFAVVFPVVPGGVIWGILAAIATAVTGLLYLRNSAE